MKTITLHHLHLENFKGVRLLDVRFDAETSIMGANGTGKTTVMDAFLWLLFGKDSNDKKDFNIKTLDEQGEPLHRLSHSVTAIMGVDGEEITLKRVLEEKWTKRRGSEEAEFSGHETTFFINDAPYSMKEYTARVAQICEEDIFKLLTSPSYFPSLSWTQQRSLLFNIVGAQSDKEIAMQNDAFASLFASINGSTLDKYLASIRAKKNLAKDELEKINPRIDEVERSISGISFDPDLATKIDDVQDELAQVRKQLMGLSSQNDKQHKEVMDARNRANRLKEEQQTVLFNLKMGRNREAMEAEERKAKLQTEHNLYTMRLNSEHSALSSVSKSIADIESELANLRSAFIEEQNANFTIDPTAVCCPTCSRPFDDVQDREQELKEAFNTRKAETLEGYNKKGVAMKQTLENLQRTKASTVANIQEVTAKLEQVKGNLAALVIPPVQEVNPQDVPKWVELEKEITMLLQYNPAPLTNPELQAQAEKLEASLRMLETDMAIQNTIPQKRGRIQELEQSAKVLAQEIASYEKIEFQAEAFSKYKIDTLEGRVNALFPTVRFRLFDQQINGGEKETCVAMIDGVPYPDLNTASKIWAGMEIINAFSAHMGVCAPIFIDNRESVVSIPTTESQVVSLYVSKEHKVLTIS